MWATATLRLTPAVSAQTVHTWCSSPNFTPAATYATGTQPNGLAVGDFNHDNILDLAVANHASNDVSLLFGNTEGTFRPAVNRNLLGLNGPAEISTADFNQDGKLDVLVANSPNNTMWYALGNGDSTFQTYPQGYGTGYGTTGGMVVGKISGLRSLDAALTKPDAGEVDIFYGNGTGGDAAALTFPAGPSPAGVALDHFNADSLTDLAIADSAADQVFILLGGGPFGFTAGGTFATGSQPNGVATADVNGDGRADLLVANSGSNTVSLLLGNGDATFQPAASFPVGTAPQRLAVGDFTGDGQVDVAVTNASSNSVSILQGNGNGTFRPPVSIPVGASPLSVVVADFNGDGRADLAVTNRDGNSVSVLLNTCGTDAMPPTTAATAMGTLGQDGWYTTDVSVALDARDETGGSGVKQTTYAATGGQQIASTSAAAATASVSITAEGQTTLTYFATDNAGNAESAKMLAVNVDKTPPTTTPTLTGSLGSNGWYTGPVTLRLAAADGDSGSGVEQITFAATGAQPIASTTVGGATASFSIVTDGQTTVTYAATDRAGNSETPKTLVIDLDQTPPTIAASHTPAPNALGWNNTDVTVSFACADTPSGVASCPSATIISAEGAHQNATGTVVDEAGNSTTTTVTGISIDKSAPTVTYAGNASSYGVLSTVSITCAVTDNPSGSGIAFTTCLNVNGPAYSFSAGTNSFAASATDEAGNIGHGSTNFTLVVTTGDLCTLTSQFVQSSARYQALPPDERLKINQIASALCRSLPSGPVAVAPTQKAQVLEAYRNGVSLLVSQGWLTAPDGATLVRLSGAL